MKVSTEIHWKFENRGTQSDTVVGSGSYIDMCRSLAPWMAGLTMNNRLVIEVNRKPVSANADEGMANLEAELEALLVQGGTDGHDS